MAYPRHRYSASAGVREEPEGLGHGEEPEGEVLAIGYQNEMLIGYVSYHDDGLGWCCESSDELVTEVTHWMKPELPND